MARLVDRAAEDCGPTYQPHGTWGERIGRFPPGDSIDPRLWLFRQADHHRLGPRPHRTCLDRADEAPGIHAICGTRRRLGSLITDLMGLQAPPELVGIHTNMPGAIPPDIDKLLQCDITGVNNALGSLPSNLSDDEKRACEQADFFYKHVAYALMMGTRPQTLTGFADSPVGLAAFMLDHDARSLELISQSFAGQPRGLTRDDVLDNITLFWLTNTAISAARIYAQT